MGETRRPQSIGRRPMTTTTERLLSAGTVEEVRARGLHYRHRRRTRHRGLPPRRPLRRRRQPVSPHGVPARQGHRQQRNPHLPLASRQVRPLQRRHVRPFRRRREGLPCDRVRRTRVGRSQPVGDRPCRAVVAPPRRRDGAQHPAGDRQVRPRTQLVLRRLPDAVDHRRQVRDHLLGSAAGDKP